MPKPWAKVEVGYMRHQKFLALNGNSIALWHEGKDYCDTHHTDGMIPREALKTFRFSGKKTVEMLLKSCGPKPDGNPFAPLWESHPIGFKMHDYLDHNDCREEVLERIEKADERREAERDRKAAWRLAKKDKAEVSHGTSGGTEAGTVPSPSRSTTEAVSAAVSATEGTRTNTGLRPPHPRAIEPSEDGNYRVIEKIAIGVLNEQGFTDESEFNAVVTSVVARFSIDYGREVAPDVVDRACTSAIFKFRNPRIAGKAAS